MCYLLLCPVLFAISFNSRSHITDIKLLITIRYNAIVQNVQPKESDYNLNNINMDYPIFSSKKTAQTVPKIIKVVNLKRFMPEAHLEIANKLKRTRLSPSNQALTNRSPENKHLQNSLVPVYKDQKNQGHTENKSSYKDFHHKQVISNGSKIKFRNCSHNHEELSTLHECVDDTLVKVGDVYDSRESFKEYLNNNAKRWHYYYICRNSKKTVIEYSCICMAYNIKQREVVIRKQKKRTTACPCKIRLTIDQNTNKLIVYFVCNHHDHPTTASAFHHYPHAKYLPQYVKEEFLDLTYLGLDVDLIQKYIHSAVGLTIKKKDIWSYAYRFKRKIFNRSISDERRKYVEGLMASIRETYDTSLNRNQHGLPISSLNHLTDDLGLYGEDLLKVLGDAPIDNENTEIIVQYITEDGIVCDENGVPIANNTTIIQLINNYAYVPDQGVQQNVQNELAHEQPPDLSTRDIVDVYESEQCVETGEVLNDVTGFLDEMASEENTKDIETMICDSHERRLSPTRDTLPVYAEMDNFRKYYYVDHRYIPYEGPKRKEKSAFQQSAISNGGSDLLGVAREEVLKAPDFVYHLSPMRHCTGHDHLTLLTDPDAISPGAKFLTHAVFLTYINERANRWFFYYSMVESGKAPENYVYKCVYGKTRVSKNAYRAKGLRKRNKLTTQCPCQIRLRRLESDPAYLTVLYSCNHHDHELDARQFTAQPHSRRLPPAIKEEVKDLIALGVGADVLCKHVFAETGVRVYGKYFHNVRASMRARGERRQHSEERLAALSNKIRDLEYIYGNAAKENPQASLAQNQPKQRKAPLPKYCGLSDRDDFAEEVCIMQADTLPTEDTAKQSTLMTRLQNLSHKEILSKVNKLQHPARDRWE